MILDTFIVLRMVLKTVALEILCRKMSVREFTQGSYIIKSLDFFNKAFRQILFFRNSGLLNVIKEETINFETINFYFDIESYSFYHRFEVVVGKNIREQTCCLYVLFYSSPLPC